MNEGMIEEVNEAKTTMKKQYLLLFWPVKKGKEMVVRMEAIGSIFSIARIVLIFSEARESYPK